MTINQNFYFKSWWFGKKSSRKIKFLLGQNLTIIMFTIIILLYYRILIFEFEKSKKFLTPFVVIA